MGKGTEHAQWLRGLLIAERNAKKWSLEQTARAIGRETGEGLSKQSLDAWEKFRAQPKIDQFASWASVLGLRLDVQLLREGEEVVMVRLPSEVAPLARDLSALPREDRELISSLVRRLTPESSE